MPRQWVKRSSRTTNEQLNAFLTYLESKPYFVQSNPFRKDPLSDVNGEWAELASILNSLTGPSRSADHWKASLLHWKNQLRSRTRKLRLEQPDMDDSSKITLSNVEARALSLFGEITVDYSEPLPLGVDIGQSTVDSNQSIKSEPDTLEDPNDDGEPEISDYRKRQRSISPFQITAKKAKLIENKDQFDRRIIEERLKIEERNCTAVNKFADAASKIADAIFMFAQSFCKK